MRVSAGRQAIIIAFSAASLAGQARAQGAPELTLPDIVVTADRNPEPIQRTGSAISVVTREEIAASNPTSLVDALRAVPGLDISETGGPGGSASVRLRGANPGQTLVLIDGIRVNDPASASGDFEFALLLPTAIERVEVLRGPQSALYGSDAIGGVVNIITRRADARPRTEMRSEAGSYGTLSTSITHTQASGPWSATFSAGGQRSDGFSRYGYRIPLLEQKFGPLERDGFDRFGGHGRIAHDAGGGIRFDAGILSFRTAADYDAGSSTLPSLVVSTGPNRVFPDTPNVAARRFTQVFGRLIADQGPLTHMLTLYANRTDRLNDEFTYRIERSGVTTTRALTEFEGQRVGSEYQGDAKLGAFGSLTYGARLELEQASTFATSILPLAGARRRTLDAEQASRSAYMLYRLPIGDRFIVSLGGRHDEVGREVFNTWRATAAYLIPETGTKFRASAGTGGKAPTLFQLFSPVNGNPGLASERSLGLDAGIDQSFFGGRATLSLTGFHNDFDNLINFDSHTQRYFNTARARSAGVEVEGGVELWPDFLRLKGAYTYLDAVDAGTNLRLQRRPEHVGHFGLAIRPLARWSIEPRVTFVSERFSGSNETQRLSSYARIDLHTDYRIDETWNVFGRIENIADKRYQEVLNYGTTGRAFYGGFNAAW